MQELDPIKRLSMFSVEVEVLGRLHIKSTLFPLTYMIQSQSEKQIRNNYEAGFTEMGDHLQKTIQQRLNS
jgi:hypothetical protein